MPETKTKLPPRATTSTGKLSARIKPKLVKKADKLMPSVNTYVMPFPKELSKIWKLKNSPGGKVVVRKARQVMAAAKRNAPVSPKGNHRRKPGYLRSRIGLYIGEDATSMYVDVVTRATDRKGNHYGRMQNAKRHYLPRALEDSKE